MEIRDRFGVERPIVGMIHLPALPGAPGYAGDRTHVHDRMLEDAKRLEAGGIDGIVLENFGDTPFYPESVPNHVVAEMSALASTLSAAVDVPVGINVLRNDADAALSIAAATGGAFVRVNVHIGSAATDQGVLEGSAHETLRLRDRIDADVAILADVHVKHATPLGDAGIERSALEAVERGNADGVIVSGSGTGAEATLEEVERVSDALSGRAPVFVGSGVTSDSVVDCLEAGASGVIVGTALKRDGVTTNPVSSERVEKVVTAARRFGSVDDSDSTDR
ncbi:BtpA/SgcQ family protein [Natrarchaeobius sp. A-rgal3]|uniref:BtpA/SgcQ family protein n=1 Tax=Natrarchaeobius versutus TaxID=1679078 RepID=UPI00350F94EA